MKHIIQSEVYIPDTVYIPVSAEIDGVTVTIGHFQVEVTTENAKFMPVDALAPIGVDDF